MVRGRGPFEGAWRSDVMIKKVLKAIVQRLGYQISSSYHVEEQTRLYAQATVEQERLRGMIRTLWGENAEAKREAAAKELLGQAIREALEKRLDDSTRAFQDLQNRHENATRGFQDATRAFQDQLDKAMRANQELTAFLGQLRRQISPPAPSPPAPHPATAAAFNAAERPLHLDAEANVVLARRLMAEGDESGALHHYFAALNVIYGYGPARADLVPISQRYFETACSLGKEGSTREARQWLVKAIELDPTNQPAREQLQELLKKQRRWDLTKQCYVYPDRVRGEAIYRETFLRALEYVAIAGIPGDVVEFGVLGGYTARIICETMRDLFSFRGLHLFDSFEGLPEYTSPIDADSYDVAGRNLWADRMRFPDSFVETQLGVPIDVHFHASLSDVIGPERIAVHRGFFSEVLSKPLPLKAALIHVDCDLYQSTKEVFERLFEMDALQDGSVVLFDDFNCFKASPDAGERRAFREFLGRQTRFEASPFFTYGFNGAAFFLHEREAAAQAQAA
jgi:O-methyltransferase